MAERLNGRFAEISQLRREESIGPISVGHGYGAAEACTFEELLVAADSDMYARRLGPGAPRTVTPIVMGGGVHYYATCMRCAASTDAYRDASRAEFALAGHACTDGAPA
jgi:hypothetical protein